MASLNGETLPTKVVAIEPILRSIKYEAVAITILS